MKLTNGDTGKFHKRKPEHENQHCDFCGYKISTHNGEWIIISTSGAIIGGDHHEQVCRYC